MDVGNKCNINCKGCYYTDKDNITNITNQEEIKAISNVVKNYKDSWFFVYPKEITTSSSYLSCMKESNQKILLSNGILMNEKMIDKIIESGIRYPKITLFANPKEQNEWQNINKETYKKIIKNIELASKKGLKVVVNTVLWKDNIQSIQYLTKICEDIGVNWIKMIRKRNSTFSNEYIQDEDMNTVVESVEKAKLDTIVRLNFSLTFAGPNFYGKTLEEAKNKLPPNPGEWMKSPYLCPAIENNYWATSLKRGSVFWCYFITDDPIAKIGSIDKKGNITLNKNRVDLSAEILKENLEGICSKENCEYQQICLGGCRSTAYTFAKFKGEKNSLYAGMDTCLTKVYKRVMEGGK